MRRQRSTWSRFLSGRLIERPSIQRFNATSFRRSILTSNYEIISCLIIFWEKQHIYLNFCSGEIFLIVIVLFNTYYPSSIFHLIKIGFQPANDVRQLKMGKSNRNNELLQKCSDTTFLLILLVKIPFLVDVNVLPRIYNLWLLCLLRLFYYQNVLYYCFEYEIYVFRDTRRDLNIVELVLLSVLFNSLL